MVSMATDSDFYIIAWQQLARIVGDLCMYIDVSIAGQPSTPCFISVGRFRAGFT